MWGFLKSMRKKQEPQVVALESLQDWFLSVEEKARKDAESIVKSYQKLFDHRVELVFKALEVLEKATLRNPNIPHREIQIMEGNREAYIRSVRQLIESMNFPENPDEAMNNENIERMDGFAKETLKQYQVLSHFFSHELGGVSKHLKELDSYLKSMQSEISATGFTEVEKVKRDIDEIFSKLERKESMEKELYQLDSDIEEAEANFADVKKRFEELSNEEGYDEVSALKKKVQSLSSEIQGENNSMRQFFMNFQSPFKKFERVAFENEELVRGYITNPVQTLLKDYDLKIVRILNNLKRAIDNGSIELKPKKKEKVVSLIINTDDSFFQDFLARYNKLHATLRETEDKLEAHPFVLKEQELLDEYRRSEERVKEVRDRRDYISKTLGQFELEKHKDQVEKRLSGITGEVVIQMK
ncbi:MAG: hypothetical protein ACLFP2_01440 [Candidatus Woesearchaeota archaeon]